MNIGANFIHGCDVDRDNQVFNQFEDSAALKCNLIDPEYGVEVYIDKNGKKIKGRDVEKLKDLYEEVCLILPVFVALFGPVVRFGVQCCFLLMMVSDHTSAVVNGTPARFTSACAPSQLL